SMLIDAKGWRKDGTIALGGRAISDDEKFIAYGTAASGSDWNIWKIFDVANGKTLSDEIKWVKFSGASWTKDGKGFYYSRFPEPDPGETFQSLNLNQKLYYHRLGTPQGEDKLVYDRPDQPKWGINGSVQEQSRITLTTSH